MSEIQTTQLAPENLSPGRTLAAARAARGLSVEDVADRLKFAPRQIEALEADDYGALPGAAIIRGMIRGYARMLELDGAALIDLQRSISPDAELHDRRMHVPFDTGSRRPTRLRLILGGLVALALAAVAGDWALRQREAAVAARVQTVVAEPAPASEIAPPLPTAAENPAPAAPEAAIPAPAGAKRMLRVELQFKADSWVEAKDPAGAVLTAQIHPAGAKRVIEGKPPLSLVIGNASGVQVRFDGKDVDLAPHTRVGVARLKLE